METTEKLISVTSAELHAILDRLEVKHTTRLAIIGPQLLLPSDPHYWSHPYRGHGHHSLFHTLSEVPRRNELLNFAFLKK